MSSARVSLSYNYINRLTVAISNIESNLYNINCSIYDIGKSDQIDREIASIKEVLRSLMLIVRNPEDYIIR